MDQKKTAVLISYLTMAFGVLVGLFYTPFMLEKVGDSEYGVYSLSSSLISFIALLDLGFGQTLVKYVSRSRALNDREEEAKLNGYFLRLYSVISIIALLIGIAVIHLYPMLSAKSMNSDELSLFRLVFTLLLVDTIISFPMCVFSATLNAYEKFFVLKAASFTAMVLRYVCMVLLLIHGRKIVSITIVTIAFSIGLRVFYALYCKVYIKIKFKFDSFDKSFAKEILWFSFFVFLNLIIDFLYSNTDKMILGAVKGTFAVTVYTFGIYFQSYFQELSTAISGVFLPRIVYLYEHDHDQKAISDLFLRVGRLQMAILALALGGYITLGKDFIQLWLGTEYVEAYYIGLLIMIPAIVPLTQNVGVSVLRAMNLHKYRSYMYLAIAVLNVVISIPLSKKYGGTGAAIGTCLACIAGQILFMNFYYAKRIKIDIGSYWRSLAKMCLALVPEIIVFFLVKKYVSIYSWALFVAFAACFALIYVFLFWFIIANDYEKDLIRGIINKVLKRS